MFKAIHKAALLGLMLVVAGCGFQLRGTQVVDSDLQQLALTGQDRELLVGLRSLLQSNGISVAEGSAYRLEVLGYQQKRQAAAYNGASAAQYRVEGQLDWRLSNSEGLVLIGPEALRAERLYTYSDSTATAALSEEKMLKRELQRELSQRLVRRVATISNEQLALSEQAARAQRDAAEAAAVKAQQQRPVILPALLPQPAE